MRYFDIETVSFTNSAGVTAPVKVTRPISTDPPLFVASVDNGLLDEIASRKEVYGEEKEDQGFRIFDASILDIVEAGYDLTKVKKVNVPK